MRLFTENTITVPLTVFLGLLFISSDFFWYGDSVEELSLPILSYTLFLILRYVKNNQVPKRRESFLIGIGIGIIFWMKYTLLTFYVGVFIGVLIVACRKKQLGLLCKPLLWVFSGMLFVTTLIVFYFLRYVCPLCQTAAKNITTGWAPLIFVNIVFIITIILSSVFPVRLVSFGDPAVITFAFISVSIMSVYPVIFSSINSLSEAATKREVEAQNKLLIAQIEAENAQLAADSQARHDRRHHNLVMLEFANNNDIERVREYLKSLVESESEVWGEVRYCENMTINTVLTVYERRAKENGISVQISANASRELDVSPQDLVIVIANLFENAIHATAKHKGKKKLIDISIKGSAQRLLIKVENPCRNNLTFDETLYGVGIRSVIATTNKYEGMYDFTAEDGIFSAKISLNV
jgi:hypothetical protein